MLFVSLLSVLLALPIIAFFTLAERKVIASVQCRRGSNVAIWDSLVTSTGGLIMLIKYSVMYTKINFAVIKGLVRFAVSLGVSLSLIGFSHVFAVVLRCSSFAFFAISAYYIYLTLRNSKSSSTFELLISKVISIVMPVYSFVVYEPLTPSLIVLSAGVFVYLYGLDSYELVFSVREASPNMEGIIDLHHDILFFLIFVSMFLWWMFSTIIMYFNDTTKPAHVYSEPVLAPVTWNSVVWKIINYIVGIVIIVALTISHSLATPFDYIDPSVEVPDCSNWRVKTLVEFRQKVLQMISVTHVTTNHAENLWTFINVNADHARLFTADPEHRKLLQFIHLHQKVFVGLSPLDHTSLHTAVSEAVHFSHLHELTGKIPCKLKNEAISKGGDFAILNEIDEIEDVYQAKTFFGNRQAPGAVRNFINNAGSANGVNGVSVIVGNSENVAEITRNISPQAGITRVTVNSIDNISENTIRGTFNKMMTKFTSKSYDKWMADVTHNYMKKFVVIKDSDIKVSPNSSNLINGSGVNHNGSNFKGKK